MEDYCSDCKMNTEVVLDRCAGDLICIECGLILESHSIDEKSEWRTFANDDSGDNVNPDRVGAAANMLLNYGGLSTVIKKDKGEVLSSSLGRWGNQGTNPDKTLILGFSMIETMSDRLGLVATIKGRANELFKKVVIQKTRIGKNKDAILAACLYLACKQENKPRTINEICSVANGTTKKEISRAFSNVNQIIRETGQSVHADMKNIHGDNFMSRFCSKLGMTDFKTVKAAQESCQKSQTFDFRRNPISIAAAVIYAVSQLSDDKRSVTDVSLATDVAEGTIRNSYKDMYPHLSKIIPTWYVQAEDLKNLTARTY